MLVQIDSCHKTTVWILFPLTGQKPRERFLRPTTPSPSRNSWHFVSTSHWKTSHCSPDPTCPSKPNVPAISSEQAQHYRHNLGLQYPPQLRLQLETGHVHHLTTHRIVLVPHKRAPAPARLYESHHGRTAVHCLAE